MNTADLKIDSDLPETPEYIDTQLISPSSIENTHSCVSKPEDPRRSMLGKERGIDTLTDDLRRSIERLDKVIDKTRVLNQAHFSLKNKAQGLMQQSDKPSSVVRKALGKAIQRASKVDDKRDLGSVAVITPQTQFKKREGPATGFKTPLKGGAGMLNQSNQKTVERMRSPGSMIQKQNLSVRNTKLSGLSNQMMNNSSATAFNASKRHNKDGESYVDDTFDRASTKSLQVKGLGSTVTSASNAFKDRKKQSSVAKVKEVKDIRSARRQTSTNSHGSNNSGSNCDASTKSFRPVSKLVPVQKNTARVESTAAKQKQPQLIRKEPIPSLNYQRSKSARPQRKALIQKKKLKHEEQESQVYQASNFDTQSRVSIQTGYSNPFLHTNDHFNVHSVQQHLFPPKNFQNHLNEVSSTQFEFSPLKRAETRVDLAIETFDFDIFQDIQSDRENFRVFQRFCLLLLIIHGELERVQKDKSDEFLKQLNVYQEVINVKETISHGRFQTSEITALYLDDDASVKNKLQQFINVVVTYSVLKLKSIGKAEASKVIAHSVRNSHTAAKPSKRTVKDFISDNQSVHSHFSQFTNRTTATIAPILRNSSSNLKKDIYHSPSKRKLSESTAVPSKPVHKVESPVKKLYKNNAASRQGQRKTSIVGGFLNGSKSSKKSFNPLPDTMSQSSFNRDLSSKAKIRDDSTKVKSILHSAVKEDKRTDMILQTPKTAYQHHLKVESRSSTVIKSRPAIHHERDDSFSRKCEDTLAQQTPIVPNQLKFPREDRLSKEAKLEYVDQAFSMISDTIEDHERRGRYLFKIVKCSDQHLDNERNSPLRQKPIDLYDLMDVELRMIRQKNLEMEGLAQVQIVADGNFNEDISANHRSKAFSHIEDMMSNRDALGSSMVSDGEKSASSRKVDMEIIDRIKNMRSKSKDSQLFRQEQSQLQQLPTNAMSTVHELQD